MVCSCVLEIGREKMEPGTDSGHVNLTLITITWTNNITQNIFLDRDPIISFYFDMSFKPHNDNTRN